MYEQTVEQQPVITYEDIIYRVRKKLGCGAERISDAPAPFQWSWWPYKPNIVAELFSDYGMETGFPDLEKEFHEEVKAIWETLNELGWKPGATKKQKNLPESFQKFEQSVNLHAEAMATWEEIAVPVRRKGEIIFRIWPPRDLLGSPIIHALPIDAVLTSVIKQSAEDRIEIERLRKLLGKWQAIAIISTLILSFVLLTLLKG